MKPLQPGTRISRKANGMIRFAAVMGLAAGIVSAEPYIAVRTGFKCSQCHVNRTGGGKRTEFGNVFSQYKLLMASPLNDSLPYSFDPKLNKSISIGANWRVEQVRSMAYKHQGQEAASKDEVVIRESNLYVNIELVKNFLTAYLDETMAGSVSNREFYGMVALPGNSYLKFGNMLLPYGFRLMDDDAFVRNNTNYTYNRHDLGYEAGIEPGPFSLIANVTNDQLSSVGSVVFRDMPVLRTFRLGGSYGTGIRKKERGKNPTYGAFGGFALGMFTVLAERDWIKNDSIRSMADYAELDFLPRQGLNFKFAYEYLWPDRNVPVAVNGRSRMVVGAEPFITQFMQIGLYYRKNDWIPQNLAKNQDEIFGRLHVFF
ncbi:MAG: hypothetical protein JWP91_2556 [Fibrobacteres bacterium]|nr:hypothetical protein [Fibrobacterota bacterium]